MFFDMMVFLRILFVIVDLSLHLSSEGDSLSFSCEYEVVISFPPMDRWSNQLVNQVLEHIYNAQPIIINLTSQNFWPC
jgi:hypothetical protein